MTKEFQLVREGNNYVTIVLDKEKAKARKAICSQFVLREFQVDSPKIKVILSDEPIDGSIRLRITKTGYYRWYYQQDDGFCSGMYVTAEETVSKFFPDFSENKSEEGQLWLKIQTN